ncbi:MAG: hypothetical protein FJ298_12405, partial [Planctomycetes bacterium]|nr:hypothetical protein [Planctomycetota bacterium]
HVPKSHQPMVLAAVKAIFVRTSQADAREALDEVAKLLDSKCPQGVRALARDGRGRARVHGFPAGALAPDPLDQPAGATQSRDPSPKRVVGIFPNTTSLLRLVTMLRTHGLHQLTDTSTNPAPRGTTGSTPLEET